MPFNKKKVGHKVVDFDLVYNEIFEPAIKEAVLSEGGELEPSWGGVLRRKPDFSGAYEKYQRAAEVSNGHPYPLLNALKLEAMTTGMIKLVNRKKQLRAAEELRKGQSLSEPPVDVPWCYGLLRPGRDGAVQALPGRFPELFG